MSFTFTFRLSKPLWAQIKCHHLTETSAHSREHGTFLSKRLWWTTFVPVQLFCSVCHLKIGKNNNRNWARQNLKDGRIELHCTEGEGLLQAVAG